MLTMPDTSVDVKPDGVPDTAVLQYSLAGHSSTQASQLQSSTQVNMCYTVFF